MQETTATHEYNLPQEITLHLLSFVNPTDMLNSRLICTNFDYAFLSTTLSDLIKMLNEYQAKIRNIKTKTKSIKKDVKLLMRIIVTVFFKSFEITSFQKFSKYLSLIEENSICNLTIEMFKKYLGKCLNEDLKIDVDRLTLSMTPEVNEIGLFFYELKRLLTAVLKELINGPNSHIALIKTVDLYVVYVKSELRSGYWLANIAEEVISFMVKCEIKMFDFLWSKLTENIEKKQYKLFISRILEFCIEYHLMYMIEHIYYNKGLKKSVVFSCIIEAVEELITDDKDIQLMIEEIMSILSFTDSQKKTLGYYSKKR